MSFKITLKPSEHEFELEGKETILRAGMRSGFNFAHNCMNGSCGKCISKLLEGKVEKNRHHDFTLSEQQKQDRYFLTCCHKPLTDLVLEIHELDTVQEIPYQEITVKVSKTELLFDDVMHLQLRASRCQVLDFLAGQKVQLCLKDGSSIKLGISSCPCDGLNLRFHVRNEGDDFSGKIFSQLKKGEKLLIKGPYGNFTLNEDSTRPLIFIAWDTGFAQIQSIIDHVVSETPDRSIQLYWLSDKEHYYKNYCRSWGDVLDNFQYETVLHSKTDMAEALFEKLEQIERLTEHELYAVLPGDNLDILNQNLEEIGFPLAQFITEAC